jgi:transposase
MAKRGAKGKYHEWLTPEGLTRIEGWARDGLTDEQIAHNMGVGYSTFRKWKNDYIAILTVLKKGKEVVDREVENAMHKSAKGYFVEEIKEIMEKDDDGKYKKLKVEKTKKWVVPNTAAQIFWLKNRKPNVWRDKQEIDSTHTIKENFVLQINGKKRGE